MKDTKVAILYNSEICNRQISCNATRCVACNLHRSRPRRQTFDKWESIESADAGVGLLPSDNKNNRGAKTIDVITTTT